jgi:uncharacterized protein YjiS (DUF1127 family)
MPRTEEAMKACIALTERFQSLKARIGSHFRDAAVRRALREELAGLSSHDMDRVLADIGLTREEMDKAIENAPRSRGLLESMLRQVGFGRVLPAAGSTLLREIERRCATCNRQKDCSDWLGKGTQDGGYRRFCPNAAILDNLPRAGTAA